MSGLQPELAGESSSLAALFDRWFDQGHHVAAWRASSPEMRRAWSDAVLDPARSFLGRPGKHFRARLVTSAWMLAGGGLEQLPASLPLVIEVLHAGSLIVDDVQDDSEHRRGAPALHREIGVPLAINTGNMLYCWSLDLLSKLALPPAIELELHRRMAHAMLLCHQGQALDLSVNAFTASQAAMPAFVRATTELKAGCLMQLAAAFGAIAAGGKGERVVALATFGERLGTGLQMLDDLGSLCCERRTAKAIEDLRLARPTWIWGWLAGDLTPPAFARLQQRAAKAAHAGACEQLLPELRTLLAGRGRARVREHLGNALQSLRDALGPSAPLLALQQEIERLEQSYG